MNYIPEIAKLLGVEIGEKFKLKDFKGVKDCYYSFSDYSLRKYQESNKFKPDNDAFIYILNGNYKIYKPILDDKEKEYLSAVIRPFRDNVKCICKYRDELGDFISIDMKNDFDTDIMLPYFEINKRYTGMEVGKKYSIEELGL